MTQPPPTQRNFALIQLSLVMGPLLFAGVSWFLHAQGAAPSIAFPPGIQYAIPVICILAASGIMVVKRMRAPITDNLQFQTISLIGWAFGEGAALLGILYYFGTGDFTWSILGILTLMFGVVMLPAKLPQP